MKLFKYYLILLLVACGQQTPDMKGFVSYEPSNFREIQHAVSKLHDMDENALDGQQYYWNKFDPIENFCESNPQQAIQEGDLVEACTLPSAQITVFDLTFRDNCEQIAHELTHEILFLKTGDADPYHHTKWFGEILQICNNLKIQPIFYPEY